MDYFSKFITIRHDFYRKWDGLKCIFDEQAFQCVTIQ
jgi:hypothetical protein